MAKPSGTQGAVPTPRSECFVVMPISDPEGYEASHFQHVFADIFIPACEKAGFTAVRADHVKETNLIHLDVLQRLLNSPMVLCDLSSRNPNVLFELGLRQAFDKPVVLVQETGTPTIFDIAPLRFAEYRREMLYHQVLEDQDTIANAIIATKEAFDKGSGINSIVRILALAHPAALPEIRDIKDPVLDIVRAELSELRNELRKMHELRSDVVIVQDRPYSRVPDELRNLERRIEKLELRLFDAVLADTLTDSDFFHELAQCTRRVQEVSNRSDTAPHTALISKLHDRLQLITSKYNLLAERATEGSASKELPK